MEEAGCACAGEIENEDDHDDEDDLGRAEGQTAKILVLISCYS
jgi:hypothetical protein